MTTILARMIIATTDIASVRPKIVTTMMVAHTIHAAKTESATIPPLIVTTTILARTIIAKTIIV
jgi:hypothetical protein